MSEQQVFYVFLFLPLPSAGLRSDPCAQRGLAAADTVRDSLWRQDKEMHKLFLAEKCLEIRLGWLGTVLLPLHLQSPCGPRWRFIPLRSSVQKTTLTLYNHSLQIWWGCLPSTVVCG